MMKTIKFVEHVVQVLTPRKSSRITGKRNTATEIHGPERRILRH